VRAGTLRDRVTIYSPPATRDTHGQITGSPTAVGTWWADVRPLEGTEMVTSDGYAAGATHEVSTRYRAGVGPSQWLVWGTRRLNVLSAHNPDGLKVELLLRCKEEILS
jgi:SPP1 family predicted phage head-tail adaptor